ncbi:MAG: hypothetical protein GX241_02935 [Ruminococcaceae bacterium]|nr:hypothetical protein [Oscillospiraceae bacterium]
MADLLNNNAPENMDANAAAEDNAITVEKLKKMRKDRKKLHYLEKNKMNFYEKYVLIVEGKKSQLDLAKIVKPTVTAAVLAIIALVILLVVLGVIKGQSASYNKYINDEKNIATYNQAVDTKAKGEYVNTQKANMESLINAIAAYPNVDKAFFTTISAAGTKNDVVVNSFGYAGETGFLSISCKARTTAGISQFVRDMVATGLFADVSYNAFTGDSEGGYNFQITCYCNSADGTIVEPVTEPAAPEAPTAE